MVRTAGVAMNRTTPLQLDLRAAAFERCGVRGDCDWTDEPRGSDSKACSLMAVHVLASGHGETADRASPCHLITFR
jgi:hypothetical protein